MGSLLRLNSTRNSRRSEIISHFRPGTGPVRSGAVNSHTLRLGSTAVACFSIYLIYTDEVINHRCHGLFLNALVIFAAVG